MTVRFWRVYFWWRFCLTGSKLVQDARVRSVRSVQDVGRATQDAKRTQDARCTDSFNAGKRHIATSNRFQALASEDRDDERSICIMENLEFGDEKGVCQIREKDDKSANGNWKSLGDGEITIDSAADESCWPASMCGEFEVKASRRNLRLEAANGSDMRHDGETSVTFKDKESGETLGMNSSNGGS